jgi:hypothetical protein
MYSIIKPFKAFREIVMNERAPIGGGRGRWAGTLFNFYILHLGLAGGLSRVTSERPVVGRVVSVGEIIIWQFLTEDWPLHQLNRVATTERTKFSRPGGWTAGLFPV